MTRRILIIEDNESLASGLKSNLEYEGYEARVAGDGTQGLVLARETRPDLIVLDLMLPDTDGFHVLRQLRDGGNRTPVMVLTALGEEADKVRGLRFGADDYVTKPFGLMEFLARVAALLRRSEGATFHQRGEVRFGSVTIDPGTRSVERLGKVVSLRPMEYDLLVALVRRNGQLATREELLVEVWGYDERVMSRTVDTHMAELRRKLEEDPANPRHLLTVRKAGYRLSLVPVPDVNGEEQGF
jgi:DNA-binding response OmpR family regulator